MAKKEREGEKKPTNNKPQSKATVEVHEEGLPEPQLQVPLGPLLAYLERAHKRGEMDKVFQGMRQLLAERGEVQLGVRASAWLALLTIFKSLTMCLGATHRVTGTATPSAVGGAIGAMVARGEVTVQFNVTSSSPSCVINVVNVTIANVTRRNTVTATSLIWTGFYTATAPVPATWASGDQLEVTVTMVAVNNHWCDTCTLTAPTSTYTVFIV